MTKEIRSPNVEGRLGVRWPDSAFGIPSDFVIRLSDLGSSVHGKLSSAFIADHAKVSVQPADFFCAQLVCALRVPMGA
jgi:hypothetical protein